MKRRFQKIAALMLVGAMAGQVHWSQVVEAVVPVHPQIQAVTAKRRATAVLPIQTEQQRLRCGIISSMKLQTLRR